MSDKISGCEFCEVDFYGNHAGRCPEYLEKRLTDLEAENKKLCGNMEDILKDRYVKLSEIAALKDEMAKAKHNAIAMNGIIDQYIARLVAAEKERDSLKEELKNERLRNSYLEHGDGRSL